MSWEVKHPNKKTIHCFKTENFHWIFPQGGGGWCEEYAAQAPKSSSGGEIVSFHLIFSFLGFNCSLFDLFQSFGQLFICFHKYWLLGCVLTCVPERTSARFCVCLTWWAGTMCARCWSRCKLRKSIRLERKGSSAAAGDAGGEERKRGELGPGCWWAGVLGPGCGGERGASVSRKGGRQRKEGNLLWSMLV